MLIGEQKTGRVEGVVISATGDERLSATVNGAPARLAVVMSDGAIVDAEGIAKETFAVSVHAYRDYLRAQGWLWTFSRPISK
jgi:hypothetical protein